MFQSPDLRQSMASTATFLCALLSIFLALQPATADSLEDILSPIFTPILDDVCNVIECGKGKCKPSINSTFFFECECEAGWKQTSSDHNDHFKFLPCIIPNCNLDYSCSKVPSPISDKASKANESIFDPCHWTDCGGGSCNKTSKFKYSCECDEGYHNILNVTAFPCLKDCAIGMDCANLGISTSNGSTSSTPALADNASSMIHANSLSMVVLLMFVAMVHWK